MEAPGGVEPPTNGLGNRCSIHLSYGAVGEIISRWNLAADFRGAKVSIIFPLHPGKLAASFSLIKSDPNSSHR
jgi:hypothetical protein